MKKLFTFFLTLFVASSVWARYFQKDGIYYYLYEYENTKVADVTWENSDMNSSLGPNIEGLYSGDIIIPESVTYEGETYSVTSIYDRTFYNCTNLTSITIPNSVTSIGYEAFLGCSSLTYVTIPNSVTSIGEKAFYCDWRLGDAPTVIYTGSATGSPWGASAVYEAMDENFLYEDGEKTIISKYIGEGGDVVIPSGVTTIKKMCFYDNSNITSITIPNTVTTIGEYAFEYCTGLTSINIPNNVTSIGERAFYGCNLTSVTINNDVDISNSDIHIIKDGWRYRVLNKNSVEVADLRSLGWDYPSPKGDVVIPSSVTAGNTFSVVGIGRGNEQWDGVFDGWKITSITIPQSITYIDENAFYWTFPRAIINESSVPVPLYGFTQNNLSYTIIGKDSVSIEEPFRLLESEFSGEVTIPQTVTFYGKTYTVYEIESYAFEGLSGLTSVTIPNTVTTIGESAFEDCTGLTSISIPSSVDYIGEEAFFGCTSLKKVTCYAVQPPQVEGEVLENLNAYLYVPCESVESYDLHSSWGNFKYIKCIDAESVVLTSDAVSVDAKNNEAIFSMPLNSGAKSYTLTISNNGKVFCTLNFNENGQLVNIDFSTTKSYELKDGVAGYQFTVTGLSAGTDYTYKFVAKNSGGSVLKEYTGAFSTTGTATAVANVEQTNNIAIVNNQILVNCEAPAFVYTISGQKIANKNLKSGVYFVVVDGETVKVVK
ncbi:MAG: leucine-rich repeat domain-containing protein [Bacteroidales bacterium]|nr:leucine-rich repeat domain-containing protein [Bacteroidales bacterium]